MTQAWSGPVHAATPLTAGIGKTTAIREIARTLAGDCKKRTIIVDTSTESGGDGDVPHAGIGDARRMQVGGARPGSPRRGGMLVDIELQASA